MADQEAPDNDGGDISSGFGSSEVSGPVSDEKAQKMLHDAPGSGSDDEKTSDDADDHGSGRAAGGGGGGGW